MDATGVIEREVRELVRRRGLDPAADAAAVPSSSTTSSPTTTSARCPPRGHRWQIAPAQRDVYDSVAGFGPLQRWLDDPSVEEIWINERLADG